MAFDTSYLYFRAYFGVPATFRAPDGRPVNAVRGTLDFISRLAAQYSPDLLACAWDDAWRPAWRVELVPSYKTHRLVENAGAEAEQVEDAATEADSGENNALCAALRQSIQQRVDIRAVIFRAIRQIAQQRRLLRSQQGGQRRLPPGGKGAPVLRQRCQRRGKFRAFQTVRRTAQPRQIAAL